MDIKELRCSEYPHLENPGNPASEETHHFSQKKIGAVCNRASWAYDCALSKRAYQ